MLCGLGGWISLLKNIAIVNAVMVEASKAALTDSGERLVKAPICNGINALTRKTRSIFSFLVNEGLVRHNKAPVTTASPIVDHPINETK